MVFKDAQTGEASLSYVKMVVCDLIEATGTVEGSLRVVSEGYDANPCW